MIGNCGDSPAPISEGYRELATRRFEYYAQAREWDWTTYGEYLDFMEANGVGVNIAGLVGHGPSGPPSWDSTSGRQTAGRCGR